MSKSTQLTWIALLIVALLLSACNFPGASVEGPGSSSGAAESPSDSGGQQAPAEPSATPAPTPSPTPLPEPPPGSVELRLSGWGMAVYAPEGWQAAPLSGTQIELYAPDESAWIEMTLLDETVSAGLGINLQSGDVGAQMQVLALRYTEDSTVGDLELISLIYGGEGALNEVTDAAYQLRLLLGILRPGEQGLLAVGHERSSEQWDETRDLYERIFSTAHLVSP